MVNRKIGVWDYTSPMGLVVACMLVVNFTVKPTYAYMVWPRATKFGMVTCVGRGIFLGGGQPCAISRDGAAASPKFLGPPLPTPMQYDTAKLCMVVSWLVFNGTLSTKRLYCAIGVLNLLCRAGRQDKRTVKQWNGTLNWKKNHKRSSAWALEIISLPQIGFPRGFCLASHLASSDELTRTTKRQNTYKHKLMLTQKV